MVGGDYKIFDDDKHSIEEPNSNFNQHRRDIIKYSIEDNLPTAIANFNNYSESTNNFQMPKLQETEWDDIINHISIISFLQGLNIGGKVYNGHSIITNTKNKEVVSEDSIYILSDDIETSGETNRYYHSPMEKELKYKTIIKGVLNIDLERRRLITTSNEIIDYYPTIALGSYDSVINQNNLIDAENIYDLFRKIGTDNNVAIEYFTALGRERNSMYKSGNDYIALKEENR